MAWYDFYKLFTIMNARDPLAKKREEDLQGVGITQPDVPDLRGPMGQLGAAPMRISVEGADFIDMTTVQARLQRYKEYDRLQNTADIENALTTFADEACLAGETPVATPFGFIPIKELAKGKKPDEQFLVYCWDFEKEDYTLGWAYHPRLVKKAPTVKIYFDNGTSHVATPDHRFLLKNGEWRAAGDLKFGDLLKPFYRIPANQHLTKRKTSQFPRIYTTRDGWKHERQFIDEWKTGKNIEKYDRVNEAGRFIAQGLNMRQVCEATGWWWKTIEAFLNKEGYTYKELRWLGSRFPDSRRVVGVVPYKEVDVYDLSVQDHENFATDVTIVHNCQEDNDGHLFKIKTKNEEIKKELEFLRRLLKLDSRMWSWAKNLYKYGDGFLEIIVDPQNPKGGILKVEALPADSMHRIESVKGRLIEFQQNKDGPDYNAIAKVDVMSASLSELQQSNVQRFTPTQIIHMRIGESRKMFYPYGVSLIEAARGPAHLLHLMEDAMLVYRLVRAPERRVFYIDVGQMPPYKVEAFMDRMKDQFRKKKVFNRRSQQSGASAVDERYVPPPIDDDIWVPMRSGAATRIDTLQGAANLGETDDVLYFRNKLYTALMFPRNYLSNQDPNATRLTLAQQDTRFARLVERLQKPLMEAVYEIMVRHLKMRGWPEEEFFDLEIKFTPPSDWRSINRNEVLDALYNRAATMKGSQLMSDYDILVKILGFDEEESKDIVARRKAQTTEEMKMQIISANPDLLGLSRPENEGTQIGTQPGGPNPMLSPDEQGQQGTETEGQPTQGQETPEAPEQQQQQEPQPGQTTPVQTVPKLPEPTPEEIKKYNLEISADTGFDEEEPDEELGEEDAL